MNYKIKVYKTKSNEWSTKAYASVTFNNSFVVTGITVREGKNNNLFVAMPSYKSSKTDENGRPIYKDYLIQPQRNSGMNFMETSLMLI